MNEITQALSKLVTTPIVTTPQRITQREQDELIRCPLCTRYFSVLLLHTSQIHKLDSKEYRRQHPGDKLVTNGASKRLSKNRFGKTFTEESKRKIGEGNRGKIISKETREKMRLSHFGKNHTEETKRKISERNRGKTRSEESKQKMREAKKRRSQNCLSRSIPKMSLRISSMQEQTRCE